MAKILYAVMGNTHGHLMRALAIAAELPEHEFHFVGGGRVTENLGGRYPCFQVPVLRTAAHHKGRVSVLRASLKVRTSASAAVGEKPIATRLDPVKPPAATLKNWRRESCMFPLPPPVVVTNVRG